MGGCCSKEQPSGSSHVELPVASTQEPATGIPDVPDDCHSISMEERVLNTAVNSTVDDPSSGSIREVGSLVQSDISADNGTASAAHEPTIEFVDACRNGCTEIVQHMLRDANVNPADDGNAAIRCAAANGHAAVVAILLLDARVNPAAARDEALISAAQNGHAAVVEILLRDERVHPTSVSYAALVAAARNGHVAVVEMLARDPRVSPAGVYQFGFWVAVAYNQLAVVEMMLQDDQIDPSQHENFTSLDAAQEGHYEVLDALLLNYHVLATLPDCPAEFKEVLAVRPLHHILQSVRTCTWRRRMDAVSGHNSAWQKILRD
jgi:hypothetical protein